MPDPRTIADRSGRLFTVIFLVCIGLLGFALYLQHAKGLDPCPWCVVQRLGFMLVGLIALIGALHRPARIGTAVYAAIGLVASAAGATAGAYHVWLQSDPARAAKCVGSPVERILDQLDIGRLSVPEWSLAWFVILAIAFVAIAVAAGR
jgi:disulfide bond formation protein DsbB